MKTDDELLQAALRAYQRKFNGSGQMMMYSKDKCEVIGNYVFIYNSYNLLAIYDGKKFFTMGGAEAKEQFLLQIESTSTWRYQKAEEYPDDLRNKQAAESLTKLHKYVKKGSEDDLLFDLLQVPSEQLIEFVNDTLSRYGFDYKASPKDFIKDLTSAVNKLLEEEVPAEVLYEE
jgi:hypothetical protein